MFTILAHPVQNKALFKRAPFTSLTVLWMPPILRDQILFPWIFSNWVFTRLSHKNTTHLNIASWFRISTGTPRETQVLFFFFFKFETTFWSLTKPQTGSILQGSPTAPISQVPQRFCNKSWSPRQFKTHCMQKYLAVVTTQLLACSSLFGARCHSVCKKVKSICQKQTLQKDSLRESLSAGLHFQLSEQ